MLTQEEREIGARYAEAYGPGFGELYFCDLPKELGESANTGHPLLAYRLIEKCPQLLEPGYG